MKADLLDISLENYGPHDLITLRGRFVAEQIPALREKLTSLTDVRNRTFLVSLENCRFEDSSYLELFLDLVNQAQGRDSRIALIFGNEEHWNFFRRWSNIFEIHSSIHDFSRSGMVERLKRRGLIFSKRTGIRISSGMALVLSLLVLGWGLTLLSIVNQQEKELRKRETALIRLEQEQVRLQKDFKSLQARFTPLRDLGFLAIAESEADSLQAWLDALDSLQRK